MIGLSLSMASGGGNSGLAAPSSAGLLVWLRADLGVTLVSGRVSSWADQSGNGNDFTQGTAGNRPIPDTGINSKATLLFDRARPDFLAKASFSAPSASEAFAVLKNTDSNVTGNSFWTMSSEVAFGAWLCWTNGNVYEDFGSTSRPVENVAPGITLNAAGYVYSVQTASNDYAVRINGTSIGTNGTNTVGFPSTMELGRSSVTATGHSGHIAEFIMYNKVLNAAERAQVMAYLRARYGTP